MFLLFFALEGEFYYNVSIACLLGFLLIILVFMCKMNTIDLARMLDAVEVIEPKKSSQANHLHQPFDYLLVLDFEATCWSNDDKTRGHSEIIEFPVVLYDVKKDKIVAEFQEYVTPELSPKLSNFCIELTGIQQNQVDRGIPLQTCLTLFNKWLDDKKLVHNMEFLSSYTTGKKKCIFATWSDWDLAICLKNECRKKNIERQLIFRKWIDIRQLYKMNYRRPLNGLNGALQEVGLTFEGRQHCGLHDARNTARLISKMISDGTMLQITRN